MKTSKAIALSVAALSLAASAAHAQGSAAKSTATTESSTSKIMKNVRADYTGYFWGPSMDTMNERTSSPNSSMTSEEAGDGDAAYLRNRVRAGYQITDAVKARAAVEWDTFLKPQQVNGRDVRSKLRDPFLQISHADLYSRGNFALAGDIRLYTPGKNSSREAGMVGAGRVTLNPSVTIPSSRFSFSAEAYLKTWAYDDGAGKRDLEAYIGPQVEYQISPTLKAVVLYELEGFHNRALDAPGASGVFGNDFTDLEPGLSWDISKNVNFSPFLNILTGGQISTRTTSVGALLSWNML